MTSIPCSLSSALSAALISGSVMRVSTLVMGAKLTKSSRPTFEESAATTLWDRDHVRPSFTPPPQQPAPPMAAPPSPKRPSLLPFVLLAVAALFVGALTFALVWAARLWLG